MRVVVLGAMLALAACERAEEAARRSDATRGTVGVDAGDPARGGVRTGRWLRAEGEREGRPLVWEFRDDYTALPTRTQLLNVSWHYATTRSDGQPDAAMQARFAVLETQLQSALNAHADLVATLDYDGQHDWYWYADSADAYHAARAVLPDGARRDIALSVEPDAKGEFYATLREKVR